MDKVDSLAISKAVRGIQGSYHNLYEKCDAILSIYLKNSDIEGVDTKEVSARVIRMHLETYFTTRDFLIDWNRARKSDPKFAITFAADRVLGKPGSDSIGSGKDTAAANIAILVQVLSGSDAKAKVVDTKAIDSNVDSEYKDSGEMEKRKWKREKPETP